MPTPFPFVAGQVLTAAQLNSISELPTRTLTGSGAAVAADAYSRVILNGTSITYTINTSTFTAAQVVEIYNANSTTATIAAGAGITLNGAAGLTLAQYQTAELYAVSATSFILWKSDVSVTSITASTATVATSQTTTSTTFTDLATVGPSVTITTGTQALVFVSSACENNNENFNVDFAISGATTRSASTATMLAGRGRTSVDLRLRATVVNLMTVTAGSNTFTMKYSVGGGTGTFYDRTITVVAL